MAWEERLDEVDQKAAKAFKSLHSVYLGELAEDVITIDISHAVKGNKLSWGKPSLVEDAQALEYPI
jgi:hypothetical protein